MELDLWIGEKRKKIQGRTQLKKSVVQSVLLCLTCLFHVYFDKQVNKNWKKNKQAKKIESLSFAESNAHRKTNACGSFETYNLFF